MPGWMTTVLTVVSWQALAGALVMMISLLAKGLTLALTARRGPPAASAQFRARNAVIGFVTLVGLVDILLVPLFIANVQPSLGGVPVGGWALALASLAVVFALAQEALDRLIIQQAARRAFRQPPINQRELWAVVAKARLISYGPLLALAWGFGALNLLGLDGWRWTIPLAAALYAGARVAWSRAISLWLIPCQAIEATPYAPLGERMRAWERLAGVRLGPIYVRAGGGNVGVSGPLRPALFVGELFLKQSDWRQIDAVLCHELGHLRHHDIVRRLVMESLTVGLGVTALVYAGLSPNALVRDVLAVRGGGDGAIVAVALVGWAVGFMVGRQASFNAEYACDRVSMELTGDPLALIAALFTIGAILKGNPKLDGSNHPATTRRVRRLERRLQWTPAGLAPWAYAPVPSKVPLKLRDRLLTIPLDQAPPPMPVPPQPWATMPVPVTAPAAAVR